MHLGCHVRSDENTLLLFSYIHTDPHTTPGYGKIPQKIMITIKNMHIDMEGTRLNSEMYITYLKRLDRLAH